MAIFIALCSFCTTIMAQTQLPPPAAEPVSFASLLPSPKSVPETPVHLSLEEAIALALRSNPAVRISELQRILDKFGLATVIQTYGVVWTPFTASATLQKHTYPVWSAGTGFSVAAPSGTTVGLSHTTNLLGGAGDTALTVTQHLLQGFGFAVNRVNYQNAMDNEKINQLTFKNSVITVVNTVITNYRALVEGYNNLTTSQQTLQSQEKGVWQSKLQVKAGKMAPADLLQQEENLETTRLSVVQAEDALRDAYQTFLSSLGLS
ncbi:MAG TPA: TolC family protein, partial [Coxiellaceae bacterium]|nr:TolC family protein [Coxiellaceae bacterium]